MRAKQFFISTQKEAPADAEIVSQKLMLRAGMIRKLAAGVYNYMPMGLRSLKKIERIVREEMDRAGAIELLMPIVQPAELWQETGRWQKYGSELLRFKDRHLSLMTVRLKTPARATTRCSKLTAASLIAWVWFIVQCALTPAPSAALALRNSR